MNISTLEQHDMDGGGVIVGSATVALLQNSVSFVQRNECSSVIQEMPRVLLSEKQCENIPTRLFCSFTKALLLHQHLKSHVENYWNDAQVCSPCYRDCLPRVELLCLTAVKQRQFRWTRCILHHLEETLRFGSVQFKSYSTKSQQSPQGTKVKTPQ